VALVASVGWNTAHLLGVFAEGDRRPANQKEGTMKNRTKGKRLTVEKKAGQHQASFKKQALPAKSGLSRGPLRVVARRAISRIGGARLLPNLWPD